MGRRDAVISQLLGSGGEGLFLAQAEGVLQASPPTPVSTWAPLTTNPVFRKFPEEDT